MLFVVGLQSCVAFIRVDREDFRLIFTQAQLFHRHVSGFSTVSRQREDYSPSPLLTLACLRLASHNSFLQRVVSESWASCSLQGVDRARLPLLGNGPTALDSHCCSLHIPPSCSDIPLTGEQYFPHVNFSVQHAYAIYLAPVLPCLVESPEE